ncbi:hypothetical protein RGQ29_006908 [Quercus rubra]|uniref:DUF4220 domain-containing protein n=1 Tax=Quercus rubra TaxID=3512 RepID=A0AAN7E8F6_QUERU|nr:hypothetical protein RGQ29_006908 [Quercus rubra]
MVLTVFSSLVFLEMRRLIQVFPDLVRKLWNYWELRVLVLVSLTLQLSLLLLASRRRYSVKTWIRIIIWFSYLGADSVAAIALGVISNNQGNSCDGNDCQLQNELTTFWAPFLLLHLGGQDTVTAYAVQDNELWLRHLLGLIVQLGVALYAFYLSWKGNWLSFLTIPMLLAGFIKYAERTWVMQLANNAQLPERKLYDPSPKQHPYEQKQFGFLKFFRRLFLNQRVPFLHRFRVDAVLASLDSQNTWKVIEVELGYAYDVFYTKAPLFFTAWGFIFRFFSFTSILFVALLFLLKERDKHLSQTDLIITYVLMVGAILVELYAVILLSASDWPWPHFKGLRKLLEKLFAPIINCYDKLMTNKQRWSNSMAQLNLLSFCLKDYKPEVDDGTPKHFARLREWVFNHILPKLNRELQMLFYRTHKQISVDLKDLVYNTFREKLSSNREGFSEDYDQYITYNGSINVEIYQRIIIWHIATDLCFYTHTSANESINNFCREVSKDISDYMMYILVMCPFVLSTGNAILSFENTCEWVKKFFQEKKLTKLPKLDACAMLISEYETSSDKVDNYLLTEDLLSLSVLLANKLNPMDGKWEILSKFWVENLAYVATLCQGNNHAQQLRKGGEFFTHVWL